MSLVHLRRLTVVALIVLSILKGTALAQAPVAFQQAWQTGVPAAVSGVLTVVYGDDFQNHRAEIMHTVRDERSGKAYRLRFEQAPPAMRTGARLALRGRAHGADLYVAAEDGSALTIGAAAVSSAGVTVGDQKTLVIVANFRDATVPCSVTAINDLVFGGAVGPCVDAMYRETSLGAVSFSGIVVGAYQIPFNRGDACDLAAWAAAADAQVLSSGVDPGGYARRVYVMPQSTCPGAGFGTIGGSPSLAWVFTCDLAGVYAHELGHNLGMEHAATPESEYGDATDPMGFGSPQLRPLNAAHRQQMGWLGASDLQVVTHSGLYELSALASAPGTATAPLVIAIQKPDTGEYYYVSYRHPAGYDSGIDGRYYNRVSVHRYKGDGTPTKTWLLAGLGDRESFSDTQNGITITPVSHDAAGATARIDITSTAGLCSVAPPSLTVAPQSQTGAAGTSAIYTVSVTNRDTAACPSTTFALTAFLQAGWAFSMNPGGLTLAPGTTGQGTLTLLVPAGALPGTYSATVNAVDSTTAGHGVSGAVSYTIPAPPPCTWAPPAVVGSPASQTGLAGAMLAYAVTVTNRDSAGCGSTTFTLRSVVPSGWSGTLSSLSATLAPNQSTVVTLSAASVASAPAGSHGVSVSVTGSQQIHAASGAMTYTVQRPADTTAPTAPGSLSAVVNTKAKQVQLSWSAAQDNVGVTGYRVFKDGGVMGLVTGTGWIDPAFVPGTTSTYYVVAVDAAGNASAKSNVVSVTLAAAGRKDR